MTNLSNRTLTIKRGDQFCTMVIFKNADHSFGESGKSPEKHKLVIIDKWKHEPSFVLNLGKLILRYVIPVIPLLYLIYDSFSNELNIAKVALFVAVSTLLFQIIDKAISD